MGARHDGPAHRRWAPAAHALRAELDRLRRRLVLTLEMIREVEAARAAALAVEPQDDTAERSQRSAGSGESARTSLTVLARKVFYRTFDNREQLASYVGLAPMPYQSGGMDRDRRISRAGQPELRRRPSSSSPGFGCATSQAARSPAGSAAASAPWPGGSRHIAIVAMARKLLIALWHYARTGLLPEGVRDRGLKEIAVGGMPVGGGCGGHDRLRHWEQLSPRVSGGSCSAGAKPRA